MENFISYWKSYGNEDEAKDLAKTRWSKRSLDNHIALQAIEGIYRTLTKLDCPDDSIEEVSNDLYLLKNRIIFQNFRISIFGINNDQIDISSSYIKELKERSRESLCLCIIPCSSININNYLSSESFNQKNNVFSLYPCDVDALASGKIGLLELIEYKIYRKVFLDKPGYESQFEATLYNDFLTVKTDNNEDDFEPLNKLIEESPEDFRNLVDHPSTNQLHKNLENKRNSFIIGPSSSGKTIFALQVGRSFMLSGRQVYYANFSNFSGYTGQFFDCFLLQAYQNQPIIIADDLQSNPLTAKFFLTLSSIANRVCEKAPPLVLAISWVDFSAEVIKWFENCYPIQVRPMQISERIASQYTQNLSSDEINEVKSQLGEDVLLLRLRLEISKKSGKIISLEKVAASVWNSKLKESTVSNEEAVRVALVVGSLGRFDISAVPEFIKFEAKVTEEVLNHLIKIRFLRKHGNCLTLGHRSLCALIVDWLEIKNEWKYLSEIGGPSNINSVVLDYLKSQGSSLAVDTLRALQARAGFKEKPQLNFRAASLVEVWQSFNSVIERIEKQQLEDATWGNVPSSAMFAVLTFHEIGKNELAQQSLNFLRQHWEIKDNKLVLKTNGLSTVDDFDQIKLAMKKEDETFSNRELPSFWIPAEDVDPDLFHQSWLMGLILCAESVFQEKNESLNELVKMVEERQLESGAFYPSRVPWCTARVLLGMAACGQTFDNNKCVRKTVDWLVKDEKEGGASIGGIWHSGTGHWNSTLETTGMVLLSLSAVGYDFDDQIIAPARSFLLSQRNTWTAKGNELDGALAIQAYLDTGGFWEDVAHESQLLSQWAKSKAFWQTARLSAKDSLDQSCRVAQISSHLIEIGWTAIRADLPAFLESLALPESYKNELKVESNGSEESEVVDQINDQSIGKEILHKTKDEVLEIVENQPDIKLSNHLVAGQYRRYDERIKNTLIDWKKRIINPLKTKTTVHENFLIWAAPGSGKSFFIQEIAKNQEFSLDYFEINIARNTQEQVNEKLTQIDNSDKPILCMIDEVDARSEESWPYETCFPYLDQNLDENKLAVFVLIGSSQTGLEGLARYISSRVKGKDLIDRVPVDRRFEIPSPELADKMIVFIGHVLHTAESISIKVEEVEKLALYYLLKNSELSSPRQIRDFAINSVYRIDRDDSRLKYECLFETGDRTNQFFFVDHREAAEKLSDIYIRIEQ